MESEQKRIAISANAKLPEVLSKVFKETVGSNEGDWKISDIRSQAIGTVYMKMFRKDSAFYPNIQLLETMKNIYTEF